MLTKDELEDLYDKVNIPFSDDELEVYSQCILLKNALEYMYAHCLELILVVIELIAYRSGEITTPPDTKICQVFRPGNSSPNSACCFFEILINEATRYKHGSIPMIPIIPYASRATATLIQLLEVLHYCPAIEDMRYHAREFFVLLAYQGPARYNSAEFRRRLEQHRDAFIDACTRNAKELARFMAEEMSTKKSEPESKTHEKLDTIMTKLETKAEKADVKRVRRDILNKLDGAEEKVNSGRGSRSKVRAGQVQKVKNLLMKATAEKHKMSLSEACKATWEPLTGGYPSSKALYVYCNAHKDEFPLSS